MRLKAELATQQAVIASQRAELEESRRISKDLEAVVASQRAELEGSPRRHAELRAELEAAAGEAAGLRAELEGTCRRHAELLSEYDQKQSEAIRSHQQHAELLSEYERLHAQLVGFVTSAQAAAAGRHVYVRATAPIRAAAHEMIAAMGSRRERRKVDLVLLALRGFAEGAKTFEFDRAAAPTAEVATTAIATAGTAPPGDAGELEGRSSGARAELEGSPDEPGAGDESAALMARVAPPREIEPTMAFDGPSADLARTFR